MKEMRVHEFADQNDCKSSEVVKELHEMGFSGVKAARSRIPQEALEPLLEKLKPFPIKRIAIKGLWRKANLTLDLSKDLMSVMHGPNGVGKTTFLLVLREIFQNRNYLEKESPLKTIVFDRIEIQFNRLGTLELMKNKKNEVVFEVTTPSGSKKKTIITARKVKYKNKRNIRDFLCHFLRDETYTYDLKKGVFTSQVSGEVILTDIPKLVSREWEESGQYTGSLRPRPFRRNSLRSSGTMQEAFKLVEESFKERWSELDKELLKMLNSVKIKDIPTRRERAIHISDFKEFGINNSSLETIDGISKNIRESLNVLNEGYLQKQNEERINLSKSFLQNAQSSVAALGQLYIPLDNFIKNDLKHILSPSTQYSDDSLIRSKVQKLEERLKNLTENGTVDNITPENLDSNLSKSDSIYLTNTIAEIYCHRLSGQTSNFDFFLDPALEKNGTSYNKILDSKKVLFKEGFLHHQVEDNIDYAKLCEPKTVGRSIIDDSFKTVQGFFTKVFLSTYLRTLAEAEGTKPFNEIKNFSVKIKGFLYMVNEQYTMLDKKLAFIKDSESKDAIRVVSDSGRPIDLADLSSGEKHIIILSYLLSFIDDDSLLLIDEPEISMHVEWKEIFLGNLRELLSTSRSRSIVATHSPTLAQGAKPDEIFCFQPND
jgi:predicted ATP-binding protein involved in virulence